jgi:hypothetical protein
MAVAISSSALGAQTLTFEADWWNGGPRSTTLSIGEYGGFLWKFFGVVDKSFFGSSTTNGFVRTAEATQSQTVAFNEFGNTAELSRSTPFSLSSAVVAGGQREGLVLTLRGFNAVGAVGEPIYTASYTVGLVPIEITPNWTDVRTVEFSTAGGTAFAQPGNFTFAIDDIKIGTVVPEPSTTALLAAGLTALGVAARRRRNRSPGGATSR